MAATTPPSPASPPSPVSPLSQGGASKGSYFSPPAPPLEPIIEHVQTLHADLPRSATASSISFRGAGAASVLPTRSASQKSKASKAAPRGVSPPPAWYVMNSYCQYILFVQEHRRFLSPANPCSRACLPVQSAFHLSFPRFPRIRPSLMGIPTPFRRRGPRVVAKTAKPQNPAFFIILQCCAGSTLFHSIQLPLALIHDGTD
jgi:hypothetical protein